MQQWLQAGINVEIPGLSPERHVREEARAEENVLPQLRQLDGQQSGEAVSQDRRQTNSECRKDAADAPAIEPCNREVMFGDVRKKDGGDQKAGNDEEDIDANEASP